MIFEILVVLILLGFIWKASFRPKDFPPGPKGLPLLGYMPLIKEHDPIYPYKALMKLSEIYGPVVGFYAGPTQPFVSVCGYEAVKEALHNEDLIGRPNIPAQRERTYNERLGIMFSEGLFWQEQRRFTMRQLRDLGFGRTSIESMMLDELNELIDEITTEAKADPNHIVNYRHIFSTSVVNILWAIVSGKRFDHADPEFRWILDMLDTIFRSGNSVTSVVPVPVFLLRLFPVLRRVFGVRLDLFIQINEVIEKAIEEHETSRIEDQPRDFIDIYLQEISKRADHTASSFSKEQLVAIVVDIFSAGAESTSNSIGFALLHLIHNPHVQKRMKEELDAVCGESLPTFAHRNKLPYTEAVLMEAQRMSSIAPLSVPHVAVRDTELQGFKIPKGTILPLNLYSVHNDAKYWGDPEVFRPERHLSADGSLIKTDHLVFFGAGKRMCPGESLAKNTYFLFVAALVKTFEFSSVPGKPLPTLDPQNGFTLGYQGFQAATRRH